jgi:hypothetical protein
MRMRPFPMGACWRAAYWRRVSPGPAGLCLAFLFPVVFFLPLEMSPFFGARLRGVAILIWLASLSMALAIRSGPGPRDEALIWLYQKGVSLGDLAVGDWILDIGLLGVASGWWASFGVLAVGPGASGPLSLWAAFFSLGLATAALAHALTLLLPSLGLDRASDLTILLAILSLLAPALTLGSHERLVEISTWLLPPFRMAVDLHGALRSGDVAGAATSLVHLLLFSSLALWWSHRRMDRWKPEG